MRTEIGQAKQSSFNDKWSITLVTYKGIPEQEYVSSEVESAPVFITEDEAYSGGERALDFLEQTGKFPNMCEVF
jgi:hypothetical protein